MATPLETKVERWLNALIRLRKPVAFGLFALSALLFVAGALLGSREDEKSNLGYTIDWDYWPEAAGGILLGLVFLGAGLWLALAPEDDVHLTGVRILVLGTGGFLGLIVFLATLGRAIRWWNVIFTGGLEAWQSAEGWRPWACMAGGLAGLAVMFASLLLAQAEERSNAILRRLLYGYNAALSGLLLLAILIVGNLLVTLHFPTTSTWTETRGIADLSSRAKNILGSLKKEVQVYVVLAQGSRIFPQVRTLLDNCQAITNKIKVKTISPDLQSEELKKLMERFPSLLVNTVTPDGRPVTIPGRGILLVYGDQDNPKQSAVAFIPEGKLYEKKPVKNPAPNDPRQTLVFKGEDALFTELNFLTEDRRKPRIYFTQDNGEPDLYREMNGFRAELERNMFSVAGLRLRLPTQGIKSDDLTTVANDVPSDAEIVVAVNPVKPFSKTAMAALRNYMAKKGKLLALIDFDRGDPRVPALPKSGLEKLLAEFNVEVEPAFLLRDNQEDGRDPRIAYAFPAENSGNRIALALPKNQPLVMPFARPIRIVGRGRNFQVEPILQIPTGKFTLWKEDNPRALTNPVGSLMRKKIGQVKPLEDPANVAVGVKDTRDDQAFLVVCGNMDIAMDHWFLKDPRFYNYLENCLQWLRGRGDKLGIKPVESNRFTLRAEDVNLARMRYLPMFLMGMAIVGLGAGIWVVRRR